MSLRALAGLRTAVRRRPARLLWLLPAGGLALVLAPHPHPALPATLASPSCIPLSSAPCIASPAEPPRRLAAVLGALFRAHIWAPLLTARRFVFLLFLFAPVVAAMPMLLVGRAERRLLGDRWGAVWWYGLLARQMQAAGPTFIKLAQWAASRADLFPALLCARLGAMHSQARSHPLAHTRAVIEHVFQRPFDAVFEHFDPVPIGTGAIAQVYRAVLKHDLIPPAFLGPKRRAPPSPALPLLHDPPPAVPTAAVAIKILHPRVSALIARDLSIMSFFAHAISLFPGMQWLSLPEEVAVFGHMMSQQLDLRNEARNLSAFEANFAHRNVPVTFPRPLETWSSPELLVEEYENALPLEAFLRNGSGPFDDQMATIGLDAFLNMLLLDNFVHSDLHPGNIMIKFSKPLSTSALVQSALGALFNKPHQSPAAVEAAESESDAVVARLRAALHEPDKWRTVLDGLSQEGYIPEVVLIDAGLVTTLNGDNRRNFLDLFRAVAEFDGYRAGELMVERCRMPELAVDPETFALKMQHIVLGVKRKTFSLGQIRISDILKDVLHAVRAHHVKMEGDFINTVLSILLLEGIGRQLDPELDLFKSALPILRQLGRKMTAQESMTRLPSGNFGALLKLWVFIEAREWASAAMVNVDDSIKYDWLVPSV